MYLDYRKLIVQYWRYHGSDNLAKSEKLLQKRLNHMLHVNRKMRWHITEAALHFNNKRDVEDLYITCNTIFLNVFIYIFNVCLHTSVNHLGLVFGWWMKMYLIWKRCCIYLNEKNNIQDLQASKSDQKIILLRIKYVLLLLRHKIFVKHVIFNLVNQTYILSCQTYTSR